MGEVRIHMRLTTLFAALISVTIAGSDTQEVLHPATGYIAFFVVGLFLLGVFLLPYRQPPVSAGLQNTVYPLTRTW